MSTYSSPTFRSSDLTSFGTTVAPLVGGLLIRAARPRTASELAAMPAAEAIAYRAQGAQSVQEPYLALAVTLFVLAVVVMAFRLPAIRGVEDVAQDQRPDRKSTRLKSSH